MEQNTSKLEKDLRELALQSIYKVAAKKAERSWYAICRRI